MTISMIMRRKVMNSLIRNLKERRDDAKRDIMISEYNRMCVAITEIQDLMASEILKVIDVLVENDIVDNEAEAKAYMFDNIIWD